MIVKVQILSGFCDVCLVILRYTCSDLGYARIDNDYTVMKILLVGSQDRNLSQEPRMGYYGGCYGQNRPSGSL